MSMKPSMPKKTRLKNELLPLADLITPNIPEGEILSGIKINDYLYENKKGVWFKGKRIKNENTHGTGCTLSSTIAANLAKGYDMENSIKRAKEFLSNALLDMLDLGKGSGPMNHAFDIKNSYKKLCEK